MRVCKCACMCDCMHVCVCGGVFVQVDVYVCMYLYVRVHSVCACVCVCVCVCACIDGERACAWFVRVCVGGVCECVWFVRVCICVCTDVCLYIFRATQFFLFGRRGGAGWRRPTGYLIFVGHFLQKSPIICGSFAKNDVQLKAFYGSSPPCNDASRWHRVCTWRL